MARNLSHNLKRVVAGLCAVLVVPGAVPAQPIADIFSSTVIAVSAVRYKAVSGGINVGDTINAGDIIWWDEDDNPFKVYINNVLKASVNTVDEEYTIPSDAEKYKVKKINSDEVDQNSHVWFAIYLEKITDATLNSAPTAKTGLTYTGSSQTIVNAGSATNGTIYYSVDGGSWGTTATAITGGTHTVRYYVKGNSGYTDLGSTSSPKGSFNVEIGKANQSLTVSVTSKTYSGSACTESITGTRAGTLTKTYTGRNGTTYNSYTAPTTAGDYTLSVTYSGNDNYNSITKTADFSISKAASSVATAPTAKSLTYSGSAQALVNAGTPSGGTMQYSTSQSGTYSTTIPTGTSAGNYTVWYKVVGDSNHTDKNPAQVSNVKINPKTVSNPTIELDPSSYTYDGNEKKPAVVVKDGSTVIPAGEYTASYSNNKNAGTATVTITDKANGNYTVSGSKTFTINKAASSASAPSAKDLTYNTNPQALVNAGTASGGTLMYKVTTEDSTPATNTDGWRDSVPEMTNAGTYYVWYYVKGDSNHNDSAVQKVDVTIKQADNRIFPCEGRTITFNNKEQSLVLAAEAEHGTVYYAVADICPAENANTWSTSIPRKTDAGTYMIWTMAKDPDGNYKTVISERPAEATIQKKSIQGAMVILNKSSVPDQTEENRPNVQLVVVDGSIVVPADDYTLNYAVDADNIGTVTVTAKTTSKNFCDSATGEYVVGKDIRDADVTMEDTATFTGDHIRPNVTVRYEGVHLHEGEDYTVVYDDNNNVSIGTSAVKIKGKGNYAGTITKTLSITAKNVSECTPEIADHVIYTGEALTPELTMKNGDVIMEQGSADGDRKDYITYYSSNTDVGTATIIVVGSGNYKDSCKVTFNIQGQLGTGGTASQFTTANVNKKMSLDENGHITAASFTNDDIDVTFAGKTLTKDTDYTVTVQTYDSASKTGVITLTGKGSYEGSVDVPFTTKNKYQTLTVADAIHENVKVGTFENSSEYSQLIPGEKYTIENNTGYVLTLKSDSDSVADVTIGKDKTVTFEVEDDVNYSLAIHTHRLIATNIDGALYVTCDDGDSTNTLLANIDTVASYTYGTPITPGVVVNEDEQNRTSNIQLKVYDSDDEVSVSALATSDVGTYTVRASLMYNGATYNLEKSFEITPKEITLTPDPDQSKTYGNADPTQFTYTTDGLIAKDIDSVAFNQYIKRQPGDIVSEYSYVLVKGETPYPTGGLTVGNYKISLAGNSPKFKISPKAISVTLTDNSFIYGDIKNSTDLVETFGANIDQDGMEYSDSTTDVPITLTIAGSTYTTAGYLNANETGYSITATTTNANYKLNVPQTLVINKKDIEGAVKLDETEFGYTHEDKTVNVVTNDGDKLTVSSDVTVVDTDSTVTAMNANEYSVKVTATNDGNYTGTTTLTWKITPHALVDADISFDDSVVYNAAEQRPVINVAGVGNGEDTLVKDTDYIVISDGSGKNVGEYTVQIRGNGNYTGTASKTFNITKNQQEVNVTPKTMVYDGAAVNLADDFVVSSEGLTEEPETVVTLKFYTKNGDDYTPVDEAKNAGTYYVTATVAATANYEEKTSEYVEFEITRRPITVTPDAGQKKIYGTSDPEYYTCTTDDDVANRENQNFSEYIGRNAGENVDTYEYCIIPAGGIVGNYAISIDPANTNTFKIVQKDIEGLFTQNDTSFTYDGTAHTLTVTGNYAGATVDITKTLGTDDYDISDNVQTNVNRTGKAEVGTYTAKVTGKGNYTGEVTFTYKINPKDITNDDTVTLALDHTSYPYKTGVTNTPELTVTDTARNAVLTGADYTSDLAGQEYVGNYTVTVEGQGNYTGTKTAGWTIEKAAVDISVAEKTGGITYDAAAVDESDFVVEEHNSDTNAYTLTYYADNNGTKGEEIDAPTNAGKYWVEASMEATDNFNAVTSTAVRFTIKKATAAITPTAGQSHVYGAKTENLAFTVDGLQGNDTQEAVFAVDPLMVVDSNNTKLANDHILQAGGSYYLAVDPDVVYDNYVTVLDGTAPAYTVTKRSIVDVSDEDIKITSEAAFVYDGNSHAVEYQTKDHVYNYGGTLVEKDLAADTDYQVTGSSGIIAKEYSLQFKGNGNYNNVKQLPWSITAKAIAAKIVAVTNDLTYNGQNVGGNFSVKTTNGDDLPAGAVVTLTYTGRDGTVYEESTTAPTNAGKYTVTATATLKNYTITFADSYDFEIKQKAVTVTPDPGQTKVYGTETPEITYSLNGVINGEDVDFTSGIVSVNCDKWADVTDTGYAYSIVDTDQGNYTLALDTAAGTFKVTPKNINEITFELDSAKVPLLNGEADASAHIIAQYGEKTLEKDTDYTLYGDTSSFVAKDGLEMTVMGIGNYTGSKDIAWSAVEKQAAVYSNSLTLNGEIIFKINVGFNSYEDLSGKTITAKLTSSVDDTRSSTYNLDPVAGERLSSNNFGYDQAYRFQIPLAPAEIGDTIFIEVFADGESIFKTNTSVLDYCRRMLRNPSNTEKFKSLLAALIDYATAAQDYFGYNSDNKADQIFTENDFSSYVDYGMKYVENGQDFEKVINKTIVDKAAINSTLSELLDGSDIKLEYTSSMFNHSSGQFMRHFFTVENATVADAVAEFSDRFGIASDEISVRVYGDEANNRIVVETSVIPQAYLRDYDKLSITLDGQTVFGYTCIDYAAVMNEKYSIEKLNKLNEKFYYFSIAAYKYYIG